MDTRSTAGWTEAEWILGADQSPKSDVTMKYPAGWGWRDIGAGDGYRQIVKLTANNDSAHQLLAWMGVQVFSVADLSDKIYEGLVAANYPNYNFTSHDSGAANNSVRMTRWFGTAVFADDSTESPQGTYNFELIHVRDSDGTVYAFDFYWPERMNATLAPVIEKMVKSFSISFEENYDGNGSGWNVYGP